MTNMHQKISSTSFVTKELQVKMTRYTLIYAVEWLKFKSAIIPIISGNVG